MRTYKTTEVANIIGIHSNTVRLYEDLGFIPKPERKANGYRVFTDLHIDILRLTRTALRVEVLQNGLRKKIINMIKVAASGDFDTAFRLTEEYLSAVENEKANAEEAIHITKQILSGKLNVDILELKRAETAKYLNITIDTLRNWEMNGLFSVKRQVNGYRVYTGEDINRLKIIRSLRCANYSLESILRMLSALSVNPEASIEQALDMPKPDEDIISVYDRLLTSLNDAEANAKTMLKMLGEIIEKY